MKKFVKALLVTGLLITGSTLPTGVSNAKASTQHNSLWIEFDQVVDTCDGPIHLKGTMHQNYNVTENKNKSSIVLHANPQGVTGIGLENGNEYNLGGSTICIINDNLQNFETSFVNTFNVIGKGSAANYKVHVTYHLTQNANGEWTATVDKVEIDCK